MNVDHEPPDDEPGFVNGLPVGPQDQSCGFCGSEVVEWLHPFDGAHTAFRMWDAGSTLPSFWAVCEDCEAHVRDGDDEALARRAAATTAADVHPDADPASDPVRSQRLVVAAFRRADLGARALAGG